MPRNTQSEWMTVLADVNTEIRVLAEQVDPRGAYSWQFCCECGAEDCSETISVSLSQYDQRRREVGLLLAPDHPVARARSIRSESEALRDSAIALRAQARLQIERARRLKPEPE